MSGRSPLLARVLLHVFLPRRDREFIIGDLEEEFAGRASRDGGKPARRWYWRQALASMYRETTYGVTSDNTVQLGEPRRGSMIDAFRQDLKLAIRSLNRRPVFTTIAVITLALGIGANTAIFSIANWLLLRPVPGVRNQSELATVE